MAIKVSSTVMQAMLEEAAQAHPRECCGILLGAGDCISAILPARNVHPTPRTHFEIDPGVLINAHRAARAGGPQVVGCYHSHPAGPAHPSRTDWQLSARDGTIWAIVAADGVTMWRAGIAGFEPLPYEADGR